jgi:hypothetical protein
MYESGAIRMTTSITLRLSTHPMTFSTGTLAALALSLSCLAGCDSGAGSSGNGVTTGTQGGPSTGNPAPAPTDLSMIDDMEDGNGSILSADGRQGAWYTYNDGTGTQVPAAMTAGYMMSAITPPRAASTMAAETTGMGFTVWGSGFGFDLNNDGTMKQPYDASTYTGVTFWAKAGSGSVTSVRMNVQDAQTAPEGGVCMPSVMNSCNDHRGATVNLTTDWQQFTFTFASMTQQGWGEKFATFETDKLYAIQFQTGTMATFDLWVDDIAFYK